MQGSVAGFLKTFSHNFNISFARGNKFCLALLDLPQSNRLIYLSSNQIYPSFWKMILTKASIFIIIHLSKLDIRPRDDYK